MEITRLPYSEGLLLTQSPQHPEHAFQLQEALALLVPGESLIIRLGAEDHYHDVRLLVEQLAKTVGIDHLELGKVGAREMFVGRPPRKNPRHSPGPREAKTASDGARGLTPPWVEGGAQLRRATGPLPASHSSRPHTGATLALASHGIMPASASAEHEKTPPEKGRGSCTTPAAMYQKTVVCQTWM